MQRLKQIYTYLLPIILILVTTLLKIHFSNLFGVRSPYLLYTAVVVISTWYSGWVMGLITNCICMVVVQYYFFETDISAITQPRLFIQLILFAGQNLLVVIMGYTMTKALKRSTEAEMRFKLLVEQATDVLVLRNEQGKAIYVSPKIKEVFDYTPEEYKTLSVEQVIAPDSIDYYREFVKELLQSPDSHQLVRTKVIRKDGTEAWTEGNIYNYLHQPGIHALVFHFKEITERVNIERQKDEFISIVSHELKTPLTSIKAFNQLMRRTNDTEKSQSFLIKSSLHITRLEKLICDLLDVTKINDGKLRYDMQPFSFKQMLEDSIETVQHASPAHHIILEKNEDITYTGDKFRLEQVMNNLLTNAVKYSPNGEKIIVSYTCKDDNVTVSVQDFGIGMNASHLEKVFERYYRVDNTAMRFEGLGLGLFISSEILKRHHGKFWIESAPDKGSTFYFSLPIIPKQATAVLKQTANELNS